MRQSKRASALRGASLTLVLLVSCLGPAAGTADESEEMIALAEGPFELTGEPVRVELEPAERSGIARAQSEPDRKIYLVLRELNVVQTPGLLFRVYLDLPEGAQPDEDDARFVGALNFFGVSREPDGSEASGPAAFRSFDVTEALRTRTAFATPEQPLTVTILAAGDSAAAGRATIGRLELLAR